MTLNGVLRQVAAAQRRAAREDARQQRLHSRAMRLQQKVDELEQAAAEVEAYEERLTQLATIHHEAGDSMDWQEIRDRPPPLEPRFLHSHEEHAQRIHDGFKAGFWQRLFGREEKLRAQLALRVVEASARDVVNHQEALQTYRQQLNQSQMLTQLAAAILNGDLAAYRQAFEELEPLAEMQEIGCGVEISYADSRTAEVILTVDSSTVVPQESKALTRTGKLSVKAMPQGKLNELYQDYVCGCALRTARELFSFLPLGRVVVHVKTTLLDSATGQSALRTILSVGIPRSTLERMNFVAADPSDAMKLFPHRMGFKRGQGFIPVEPLAVLEFASDR